MKSLTVLTVLILAERALAFVVKPHGVSLIVRRQGTTKSDDSSMQGSVHVKRAKECAEHPGKCTADEMEKLRDGKFCSC